MRLDELGEDASDGLRMEEDDRCPVNPDPDLARLLEALGDEARDLGMDVVDRVREVVQAGPALGYELPDRGVGLGRREQLQLDAAGVEEREVEPVQLTAPDEPGRQGLRVEVHSGVDVSDRDPDVVKSLQHEAYCRLRWCDW